tara:strand:- start:708 stop:845 length:138 start_codon:yes stop_codon:yes gene_type:complete
MLKKINDIINKGIIILFNKDVSIIEIEIMIINDKVVKVKCFEKKK